MEMTTDKLFQAREFARLTGVTVRTLHHYDRLGLLKPGRYTPAGYRLYSERDFARLEQIVALKFIGFSLKQIKNILDHAPADLVAMLRQQREAIEEKRQWLELAIRAIQRAEFVAAVSRDPGWEAFAKIIEVINMQSNMDWSKKYYSEEAEREIKKRAATIPRETIEQAQRDWATLISEVQTAVASGEDPASKRSQELANRWRELIRGFTGGDPEIQKGLNRMYRDKDNWPTSMPRPFNDDVQAFITDAMKHCP